MAIYNHIWPYMTIYGHIWAIYGPYMTIYVFTRHAYPVQISHTPPLSFNKKPIDKKPGSQRGPADYFS